MPVSICAGSRLLCTNQRACPYIPAGRYPADRLPTPEPCQEIPRLLLLRILKELVRMALLADDLPTVVPGFYGIKPDGKVHTFSRGGSDITGAIVARAVSADTYENWTDVSGFLMADPRIVKNPREISRITYAELRELSYMGATVLHEDAMFPVHKVGIPTVILNTNHPEHPGTLISLTLPVDSVEPTITGVAGHQDFSVVAVEKAMMN